MTIKEEAFAICANARNASTQLAKCSVKDKNLLLQSIANDFISNLEKLIAANLQDIKLAEEKNLDTALVDRLRLGEKQIRAMAEGLQQIAELPDPIGEISEMRFRPSGIQVGKMRVPLGVVMIIYESRPNVTADAAALCLKSGNAAILRGGSEAWHSNQAIAAIIKNNLHKFNFPENAIQVLENTDRQLVGELITMRNAIDVLIPRGGKGLISRLLNDARIPMIQHLDGNCHIYVNSSADLTKAIAITDNAKTQRYAPCNTAESLLVDAEIAAEFLPTIAEIFRQKNVEMRGCPLTLQYISDAVVASEEDYYTEYLAPIISIKVVANLDEAINHINKYSSHHSDAIIAENYSFALRFLREVDSSSVLVNASTRFADGFEYGLGAEIGISTDKIHARGPVGLHGLTSEKWIVFGNGQIRQ